MMNIEMRKGKKVPVIKKALVDLKGPKFSIFEANREKWALGEHFNIISSVQYEFEQLVPYLVKAPEQKELYLNA